MPEFISVSATSYDPASLAAKLTEKSSEGWTVVAIVPTGGDITAFLSRGPAVASAQPAAVAVAATTSGPVPVAEPAGWGSAPVTQTAPVSPSTPQPGTAYASGAPSVNASVSPQPVAVAAAAATSSATTPAGWYHDPSGRFELRYWDGAQWTEHVARAGNQFTDPPVA